MTAVLFPSQYEAADLLTKLNEREEVTLDGTKCYVGLIGDTQVLVSVVGIGAGPSASNTRNILQQVEVSTLILAGFAGALTDQLQRGQVLIAQGYASDEVVNFLKLLPDFDVAGLHTADEVVGSPKAKEAIAIRTGCQMVDMETSHVAAVAREFQTDLLGIRAISDLYHEEVPAGLLDAMVDSSTGKPSLVKAGIACLSRPHQWGALKRFMQPLPGVRAKLTTFLESVIHELD